ncbi:folate family ECF transporter S component [Blautia sp. AF25-12LB]|nr:folate family ECF transporter S component [Blautia sp. AF25-12LB]
MKKLNVKTIVFAAVLVAMNLVLSRVLAINIGSTLRITVSATPIYLASLWFGPLVGGICGGLGDLLGCLIQGYAPNPLILVSSVLAGVIPAVFKKYVFRDKVNTWKIAVMLIVHGIVGSLGFTVVGLHVYYATPWSVLYATRVIQTIALTIANTILVSVLYQSALTSYVNQVFALQRTREV